MKFKNLQKQYYEKEAVKPFQRHEEDSGSPEAQIALLTFRIQKASSHMLINKKDFSSLRGLKKMSSTRKKLMKYLKENKEETYKRMKEETSKKISEATSVKQK